MVQVAPPSVVRMGLPAFWAMANQVRRVVPPSLVLMKNGYQETPPLGNPAPPTRRQVIGILYSKDLLRARLEPELMTRTVDMLMRKPLFVAHSTRDLHDWLLVHG